MCFVCRGFIITILLLRAPSFKGRGVPRPPLTSLDIFIRSPASFFLSLRGLSRPAPRIPIFSFYSPPFSLPIFFFIFPTADPLRRALPSLPLFLSSFTSPLFIIYPLFSLQRPFILPARRYARPQGMQNKQRKNKKPRAFKHAA